MPNNEMSNGVICADKFGDVIYGGAVHGSYVKFDTMSLSGTAPYYYIGGVVAKFTATGHVKWVKRVSLYTSVTGVGTDALGNIYIAGYLTSTTYIGGLPVSWQGNNDVFVAKLDPNGNYLWAKGYGGCCEDDIKDFSVDSAGNFVFGGHFYSTTMDFGNSVTLGGGTSMSAFVAKCDANGNALWARYVDAYSTLEEIVGVNIDASGNTTIVGTSNGTSVNYGGGVINTPIGEYTIKYNSSGNVLWTKNVGGSRVTSDRNGNIYSLGTFAKDSIEFGSGVTLKNPNIGVVSNGWYYNNFFLVKYSSSGIPLWARTNDGNSGGTGEVISKDKNDNLLIAGRFFTPSFSIQGMTYADTSSSKYFMTKCDTAGNFYWIKGGSPGYITSVAPDASNNYMDGGNFSDSVKVIGNDTLFNPYKNPTMFITMLPPCGGPYANAGPDTAICLNNGIMLHAWGGQTYSWAPTTGLSDPNISNPIASPTTTTQYTVTVTNECGTTTDVMKLNVRTSPLIGIVGTNTVCSNASVVLTGSGVNTYTWMPGSFHSQIINATAPTSTVYTLTGNLGSCLGSKTFSITSLPAPNVAIIQDTACWSRPHIIKATGATSYTWSTGSHYDTTIVTTTINNKTYTVTGSDGTCSAVVTKAVPINYVAAFSGRSGQSSYCTGSASLPMDLYSNPTGAKFFWFNDNPSNGIPAQGFGTTIPAISTVVAQNTTIRVVPDYYGCKGDTASFTANVNLTATVTPVPSQALCGGSTFGGLTFTVDPPGTPISWTNNNTHIGLATGTFTGNIAPFTVPTMTNGQMVAINYVASGSLCNSTQTFSLDVEQNCVWPGDADENLVVNNTDLFPIGIKYGKSGVARVTQGNNWQGVPCWGWSDWQYPTGYNTYFADCNGNGTVDIGDTLAINLNYSLTHAARSGPPHVQSGIADVYVSFDKPQYLPGDTVNIYVSIGDFGNQQSNFYGAAFTLNYDNSKVEPGTEKFFFNDSWVGTLNQSEIKFSKIIPANGIVDASLVRTTHTDISGSGQVGTFQFILPLNLTDCQLYCSVSNSIKIDHIGNTVALSSGMDSSQFVNPTTSFNHIRNAAFSIFPNPATDKITIQSKNELGTISILNSLGENVFQSISKDVREQIDISKLPSGIYFVEVKKNRVKLIKN
ncbi:MAG: T9SS type A sorting domain-containing protein [Bacteroidia bacterium]